MESHCFPEILVMKNIQNIFLDVVLRISGFNFCVVVGGKLQVDFHESYKNFHEVIHEITPK